MGKKIETTKKVLEKSSNVANKVAKVATAFVAVTGTVLTLFGSSKK
ncbi:MAG: hypothetical protein ACI3ZL_05850 [Candidatus Cryptobacteroides sp.]